MDKAIPDFIEAIRRNPKDAKAYRIRSAAYELQGNQVKATANYARAKELGFTP